MASNVSAGAEAVSTRSRLSSRASRFVPGQGQSQQQPLQHTQSLTSATSTVAVRCIIEGALGKELCGVHIADMQSHKEIEVSVQSSPSAMYGPWGVDPQERARVVHLLVQAFKILGSKIQSLEPSADNSQLQVKYSEAPSEGICWEFGQYGYCQKYSSCRWNHPSMDIFVIKIAMQHQAMDFTQMPTPSPADACGGMVSYGQLCQGMIPDQQVAGMYWVPVAVPSGYPSFVSQEIPCGNVVFGETEGPSSLEGDGAVKEPHEARDAPIAGNMSNLPTSPSGSAKTRSGARACWADIEDDDA